MLSSMTHGKPLKTICVSTMRRSPRIYTETTGNVLSRNTRFPPFFVNQLSVSRLQERGRVRSFDRQFDEIARSQRVGGLSASWSQNLRKIQRAIDYATWSIIFAEDQWHLSFINTPCVHSLLHITLFIYLRSLNYIYVCI